MLLAVALLLLGVVASSQSLFEDYCEQLNYTVPPCNTKPRDLLFLVDGSESMAYERFYTEMLDYTQALYCAFSSREVNQAGMIVFKNDITVPIPLQPYTRGEWYEAVEGVRDMRGSLDEPCCQCCTPMAETFDLALELFENATLKNEFRIAFVITDGFPSNNNVGSKGGDPRWAYISRREGFNPARYEAEIVARSANRLKEAGNRLFLVGIPNRDFKAPNVDFFSGSGKFKGNRVKHVVTRDNKKWTWYYKKPFNPIVSLPVDRHSFSMATWGVGDLVNGTVDALCEQTSAPSLSPTFKPTMSPATQAPTFSPTFKPTSQQPTMSPSTSYPSRRPTLFPTTLSPTVFPTESPSLSAPSKSPTLHPTTLPPTVAPSKSPSTSYPSFSPSRHPTTSFPTLSPTKEPTTLAPTKEPTLAPSGSPSTPAPTMFPTRVTIVQLDMTFVVDRSDSINSYGDLCGELNVDSPFEAENLSECWETLMRYVLDQSDLLAKIPSGVGADRELGWASEYNGEEGKGLRVNVVGFSCSWDQKKPIALEYSKQFSGGPITSRAELVRLLEHLVATIKPTQGTCPGLALEKAVHYVEETSFAVHPFQSVILITDGIFYDGEASKIASLGLGEYRVSRFAIGLAVGQVPVRDRDLQAKQLSQFVGYNRHRFSSLGTDGWRALSVTAQAIAREINEGYDPSGVLPRRSWCGFQTYAQCAAKDFRWRQCRWSGKRSKDYGCEVR